MFYEYLSIVTSVLTLICGGGWFVFYRANKRIKEGEAFKTEQEVYQETIKDLKESCDYIKTDRNLLREENTQLRQENNELRKTVNELQDMVLGLKNEVSRLGRKVAAMERDEKNLKKKVNGDDKAA